MKYLLKFKVPNSSPNSFWCAEIHSIWKLKSGEDIHWIHTSKDTSKFGPNLYDSVAYVINIKLLAQTVQHLVPLITELQKFILWFGPISIHTAMYNPSHIFSSGLIHAATYLEKTTISII